MKNSPTLNQWKQLYQYAEKIKELAPWEWMYESDVFGLSLPEYEENFYVSVLGNNSEHFAFCILQGDVSLGVFDLLSKDEIEFSGMFFYMTQLQISYEDREFCEKKDLEIIKKLGLKFRGSNDYPTFRAMHAGYLPYFIDRDEAQVFLDVLEQSISVVKRFQQDEDLFYEEHPKKFFRVKSESGEWKDEYLSVPNVVKLHQTFRVPQAVVNEIMDKPTREAIVEMEIYIAPFGVNDEEGRPYAPLVFLLVDKQSGGILNVELFKPARDFNDFLHTTPVNILNGLNKLKIIPVKYQMSSDFFFPLFKSLFQKLGLDIELVKNLPNLERAKASMTSFFASR
ncbi:hypothetical protein B6D60_05065 [candidate division KSB1 bacterium 4484_87]|nr:MAG: hypothetical protein B6D60_05065 [candidate division KSB1 bacterium 4484_87]